MFLWTDSECSDSLRVRMRDGTVHGISKGGVQELHTITKTAQRGTSERERGREQRRRIERVRPSDSR